MGQKSLLAAVLVALAISPASSQPSEEIVQIPVGSDTIAGTMTFPANPHPPVILMLHGFAGNRNEENVFPSAAAALAVAGMASLRIDFRGAGQSDGDFADTTFSRQVNDARAAMQFLDHNPAVDSDKMGVIGISQGGMIAAIASSRSQRPKAIALWSPVADPPVTYERIFGLGMIEKGLVSGRSGILVSGVLLRQPFFDEINRTFPLAEISSYQGALFAAEGDLDGIVGPHSGEEYVQAHHGGQLWRQPMDHDFNLTHGPSTLDALINQTIVFFQDALAKNGAKDRAADGSSHTWQSNASTKGPRHPEQNHPYIQGEIECGPHSGIA